MIDKLLIPKKHKRFTQKTIESYNKIGLFDDVDLMHEKYTEAKLKVNEELEEVQVKTIGMWMSGGADSSLLAYLLCKKIKDENLDVRFQPLSVRRGRPWNPLYASGVIEFIENDLNFDKMNNHIVYYPDLNDEYYREIKIFREKDIELFNNKTIDVMYSGITCNPPADDPTISKNKERTRDEDAERPTETHSGFAHYMNPFFDLNKKNIKKIYDHYGLTNNLFPITRSCEGSDYESGNYTYHCGKCWWCEERIWAFGRLQ